MRHSDIDALEPKHPHSLSLTHSLTLSLTHSLSLSHSLTRSLTRSLTHSCIDDSEMDPRHTESQGEKSASDRVPGIRHREGGGSEARQGAVNKTAEGNKHAEGHLTGPVEPRRDQ